MRIPLFVYDGKEFTTTEDIDNYSSALWEKYYKDGKLDEAYHSISGDFEDSIQNFIYNLLHSFTVTKDILKPAKPDEDGNEDWRDGELEHTIAELMWNHEWIWNADGEETTEYDLEKSWANKIVYFNSPFDENIAYAFAYTESPYISYDEDTFEIFAAKKVLVQKYEYQPL